MDTVTLDKEFALVESKLKSVIKEASPSELKNDLDSVLGDIEYTIKDKTKTVPPEWKKASQELTKLVSKYL